MRGVGRKGRAGNRGMGVGSSMIKFGLFLWLVVSLIGCVEGRKGAPSLSQLHEDQSLTEIGAGNSPTGFVNAHPCPRGRYRPTGKGRGGRKEGGSGGVVASAAR